MNTRDSAFGVSLGVIPFDRAYWVVPGKVLAGFYPGGTTPERAQQRLDALLSVGVTHVVNLTEDGELTGYADPLRTLAKERGIPITIERMAIADLDIPTIDHMAAILDNIDAALERKSTVYVHCWGGRGRTATVVGCWLARHDMATGDHNLQMIRYLRRTDAKADTEAPETEAQKQFVRDWKVRA